MKKNHQAQRAKTSLFFFYFSGKLEAGSTSILLQPNESIKQRTIYNVILTQYFPHGRGGATSHLMGNTICCVASLLINETEIYSLHFTVSYFFTGAAYSGSAAVQTGRSLAKWGGALRIGLRSKKFTGLRSKLADTVGIIGKSSWHGIWWNPIVYHKTMSLFSIGRSLLMQKKKHSVNDKAKIKIKRFFMD